jgi:hypothetical protein
VREDVGDLWTYPAEFRLVPVNGTLDSRGHLVMGAGVALRAKERYPKLPALLGRFVSKYGNRPFYCGLESIISFPTKRHWKDPSDPALIEASCTLSARIADKWRIKSIAMPRVGCGLGGLDWALVRNLLKPLLDDRFIVLSPCTPAPAV